MDSKTAFAAVAHCAVYADLETSDMELTAFVHELTARHPYKTMEKAEWDSLIDELWDRRRKDGSGILLAEATIALSLEQRLTAFAVACKIVASDGEINDDEAGFLINLAETIGLTSEAVTGIVRTMKVLCREVLP